MPASRPPVRVSAVSFFNTVALVYGLAGRPGVVLKRGVPSSLLDDLRDGSADVALLPTIDYQKMDGLVVLPVGGIGCDGPTLTVRLFADRPIERTATLAVDGDSHTSVALARIVFDRVYGLRPNLVSLAEAEAGSTRLLIGDKVITAPPDAPYQLDLGGAWKKLTGLPFVFAVWTARAGVDLGDLPQVLRDCLREGLTHVDDLVRQEAIPRGWPTDAARKYLTEYLQFSIGSRQIEAITLFHQLAWEVGALDRPPRAIALHSLVPSPGMAGRGLG